MSSSPHSSDSDPTTSNPTPPTRPLQLGQVALGSIIAGAVGYAFYQLLQAIVFKLPPVNLAASPMARGVSLLVRYLLVGSMSLITFLFAAVGLGLLAYAGQLLIQSLTQNNLKSH